MMMTAITDHAFSYFDSEMFLFKYYVELIIEKSKWLGPLLFDNFFWIHDSTMIKFFLMFWYKAN